MSYYINADMAVRAAQRLADERVQSAAILDSGEGRLEVHLLADTATLDDAILEVVHPNRPHTDEETEWHP